MCHVTVKKELSSLDLIKNFKGGDTLENKHQRIGRIVDARDVADAILLTYENHEAEERYICTSQAITARDLVEKLKSLFPNYKYPTNYTELDDYRMLSSEKLQSLGWKFRPLEETLIDSVKSYEESGVL
ncbi:unnamed protein product [Trifolium pratense]|uniref:Uncharacterized protein n=1 Tax=Trifolium pratense TaxID=57577 RepID=A0ACB0L5W8_TRIPR|nr:unnamed protein product [Trifolium pratense]